MAKLIPPDRTRCQCEIRPAYSAFQFGPRGKPARCSKQPVCILTEKEPGADGQCGAMSLCGDCFVQFCMQCDVSKYDLEKIDGKL